MRLAQTASFAVLPAVPERWDEDKTRFQQSLFLEGSTYRPDRLFDVPASDRLGDDFVVSPAGNFSYRNAILPKYQPLALFGRNAGCVQWDSDVVIPMLLDMTRQCRTGEPFPREATPKERASWGAVWMAMTPAEMLSQRSGIHAAHGTVLIGGLGLGWFLRKVCEKESVERVIVVDNSQEVVDWYGYDLCRKCPKVSELICDDVYNHLGKHGKTTMHLLDIWPTFNCASQDERLRKARKRVGKIWAWGIN